ncbi:EF-hand domain-containing protein [Adhaeretor mobilis]|uniref:EF hand n=1 Tax=Adhaeretor mobilis TaxID=1930276 RepID=A0A517MUI6_9BACT|nr:hypothetical protein [Adhaeretor mobilis]QDS98543.1 EF hand [Adhaeretor mobilis]
MRIITLSATAFLAITLLAIQGAVAQPPSRDDEFGESNRRGPGDRPGGTYEEGAGRERRGEGGPRGGEFRGRGRPQNLIFEALDLNSDGEISAVELRKAAAALKKLDKDKDGTITLAEVTPEGGPGRRGGRGGDPQQFVTRMMENDKNGDGKLTPNEVPEQLLPMLQGGDKNGDKAIDAEELAAIAEAQGGRGGGRGGQRGGQGGGDRGQAAEQMIQRSDSNNDGRLTPDEVPERMRQMLQGSDTNGDGSLDAAELGAAMEKMGQRRRGAEGGGRGAGGPEGREGRQRRPE